MEKIGPVLFRGETKVVKAERKRKRSTLIFRPDAKQGLDSARRWGRLADELFEFE